MFHCNQGKITTLHIYLHHPDKLAMAEHSMNMGHNIRIQDISILGKQSTSVDWIAREVTRSNSTPKA
jgi:hypothetical protein